jgi:hypothetical protein
MTSFYDKFLLSLHERFPGKSNLVNAIADLLPLEKESIYRRLRGEVLFTAAEMMHLAGVWNISLDSIVAANPEKTSPFHLKAVDFIDPTEEDYAILEQHNRDLALVADAPDGIAIEVVNTLPRGLYSRSEHLTRFFTMKWRYKNRPETLHGFDEIRVPDRMRELDEEYVRISHRIPEMHSIHDPHMIGRVVEEIVFYRSIGMLTDGDVGLLRDELLAMTDYMEEVTRTGIFPAGGGRMYFYLSHTWIETEYFLYRSRSVNLSLVKVLERYYLSSLDEKVLDRFMTTAQAAKRMSVLMSESNALQQAEFFSRQREKILTL